VASESVRCNAVTSDILGEMSAATKKKHVTKEVLDEYVLPEPHQRIVQIVAGKGNNLHQVFDPQEQSATRSFSVVGDTSDAEEGKYLVSMPTKFRKSVWIKRGDFVIVEPIEEGDKVKAEIVRILYKEQVKHIKKENLWPKFPGEDEEDKSSSAVGTDDDIFVNTNRPNLDYPPSDSSSSSSGSESDDDTKNDQNH